MLCSSLFLWIGYKNREDQFLDTGVKFISVSQWVNDLLPNGFCVCNEWCTFRSKHELFFCCIIGLVKISEPGIMGSFAICKLSSLYKMIYENRGLLRD